MQCDKNRYSFFQNSENFSNKTSIPEALYGWVCSCDKRNNLKISWNIWNICFSLNSRSGSEIATTFAPTINHKLWFVTPRWPSHRQLQFFMNYENHCNLMKRWLAGFYSTYSTIIENKLEMFLKYSTIAQRNRLPFQFVSTRLEGRILEIFQKLIC